MRRLSLTFLALAVFSCVTPPKPKPVDGTDLLLRLSPASLGRSLQLAQRITVLKGADRKSLDAQLEVDSAEVRIAAVAMGQTVASLTWNGTKLTQQVSMHVPEAITAERILSDVQLAWWPLESIRSSLPVGFAIDQVGAHRTLSRDGTTVATIDYDGTAPAWAHVRLAHARYGYELDIESVELDP